MIRADRGFERDAKPESVRLLKHLLEVGRTTRRKLHEVFWEKAIQIGSVGKALTRLDDDLLAYAPNVFVFVKRGGEVWIHRPDQNGTETD